MKFRITEMISDYTRVEDEFKHVEVRKRYSCKNWDDMQNLVATLIEAGESNSLTLKFEKVEEEEE